MLHSKFLDEDVTQVLDIKYVLCQPHWIASDHAWNKIQELYSRYPMSKDIAGDLMWFMSCVY